MSFTIENGRLRRYQNDTGETSLSIPDSVQSIGSFALEYHSELTTVSIPAGVREICDYAFHECPNLMKIQVSEKNRYFADIDGVLYNRQKNTLLCCPDGLERIHLPASVISIKDTDAFTGCHRLKEITVDQHNAKYTVLNGILYEHDGSVLTKLIRCPVDIQELHIPESITEVCRHAFASCENLEKLVIPESVKSVGDTLGDCRKLNSVICHGIDIPIQYVAATSAVIWMIINKKPEQKLPPVTKYLTLWQMFLKNQDDQEIEQYIQEHFKQIIYDLIRENQLEAIQNYVHAFRKCLTSENLDKFIRFAIHQQRYAIQIFLTDLKYQQNDFTHKDWSL